MPSATLTDRSPHPSRASLTHAECREETARALAAAHEAEPGERGVLLNHVVCLNMGMARSVAARYFNRGVDNQDLIQVAYLALTRAARSFRPDRHTEFLAYAVPTIRGEVKKHFRDRGWAIRPTRVIQESQVRLGRVEEELVQLLGRSPRVAELAEAAGLDRALVAEALAAEGCFAPRSLDVQVRGSDRTVETLGDHLPAESREYLVVEARVLLAGVLGTLSSRDRLILRLRFFEDRTQQQIADQIGLTQMQVSRLLTRILRDLRREIVRDAPARDQLEALLA